MDRDELLADRLETLSRFSTALSHKLSNHLTYVLNYLFLLKSRATDEGTRDLAEKAELGIVRIKDIFYEMADLAHPGPGPLEDVHLCSLIQDAADPLRHELRQRDIHMEVSCPQAITARTERRGLAAVISHLLDNASQSGASWIRIAARADDGQHIISIEDNGSGMDAEEFKRVSEPFVTGRPGSLGLGLSRCIFILHSLGGGLACQARPGGGTELLVTLPSG